MKYLSVIDHKTNKRLAFLQNAYNIEYTKELNSLWTASFSMPLEDNKNQYCDYFNFIELYDGEDYAGLFRIMPTQMDKSTNSREIVYECEHVLATLMDDVLFGWHEIGNIGVNTWQVLQYILGRQTVTRWQLGQCDFNHQFLYGWEHENLLSALFSVPKPFASEYRWTFDTTTTPWTISLRIMTEGTKAEIRYKKNMLGISKSVDPTSLCTRLYPLGYGEGDNQLNISSVNSGKMYIDADTQSRYGIVSKIWIDQRYQYPDTLYNAALAMLEELKSPTISYSVESLHIGVLKDCDVGDMVRVIDDEEKIDFYTRIVSINKPNVTGAPNEATITLANKSKDIASSISDLADRQRINEAYSQGAVTLYTLSFRDNCSTEYPAEMKIYIPQNVVHINQILLSGGASAFRGYTQAVQGGGASASTTSSGGGTYAATGVGGGSQSTSSAGGGGYTTSDYVSLPSANSEYIVDGGGVGSPNHNHGMPLGGGRFAATNDGLTISGYYDLYPSGAHNHGTHNHSFNLPAHAHTFSTPNHSHTISVDAHSHNFSVPNHTHAMQYGIYTGTTASSMQIYVDGVLATAADNLSDFDIIPYLSKDDGGNITRGWHTVTMVPDVLTRVEMDAVIQLYANSRGGGQY